MSSTANSQSFIYERFCFIYDSHFYIPIIIYELHQSGKSFIYERFCFIYDKVISIYVYLYSYMRSTEHWPRFIHECFRFVNDEVISIYVYLYPYMNSTKHGHGFIYERFCVIYVSYMTNNPSYMILIYYIYISYMAHICIVFRGNRSLRGSSAATYKGRSSVNLVWEPPIGLTTEGWIQKFEIANLIECRFHVGRVKSRDFLATSISICLCLNALSANTNPEN